MSLPCRLLLAVIPPLAVAGAGPAFATTGGPVTALGVSPPRAAQRSPAAIWDGSRYVVVFEEDRGAQSGVDLVVTRLSAAGAPLDGGGIPVQWPAPAGNQRSAAIAVGPIANVHFITWIDPRNGGSDVYATRFDATDAHPGIAEPEGLAVATGGAFADPTIACSRQNCLVAFTLTAGGEIDLRGSRLGVLGGLVDATPQNLIADGTGRNSELSPFLLGADDSFTLVWEDDRSVSAGLGAEIYGRIIPNAGLIIPNAGVLIGSGPRRQSAPAMALIGGTSLITVWQDQRAVTGTVADDDIWRGVSTPELAPSGTPAVVVPLPRNQVLPEIAGGPLHALLVWEDFRSPPYGAIAATRLDSTGAPLDPSTFIVGADASNLIEHLVVKGPGDDFLVMWVRFLPAPAKIMWRIIRDELPAGSLTPPVAARVPADGVTKASLRFEGARGASGFEVIDGTAYTVTLSRANVAIDVPDADLVTAGHQLPAIGGGVTFGLSTLSPGSVDVSLRSVEGTSTGTTTVVFANVAPVADGAEITPGSPLSSEDLVLSYTYRDINGDPESGTRIEWTKNLAVQSAFTNARRVPASATRRGERWRAQVQPFDGTTPGSLAFTNEVVVRNSPPTASAPTITPATGVRTGTRLVGRYTFDDPDQDADSGSAIRWFERGVEQAALRDMTEVPGAMVAKGQRWSFEVRPSDGLESGPAVRSGTVSVENTRPVAEAGVMASVVERRMHTLDGTGSSDVDPGDVLVYRWRQIAGPAITLSSTASARPTFTAPGVASTQMVELGLVVGDGAEDSPEDRVVVLVTPVADTDADGLDDEEEQMAGTDPARGDTDRDGMQDGAEVMGGLDPKDDDTDDDGLRDGAEPGALVDTDGDQKVGALDSDSDGDGVLDGTEAGVTAPASGTMTAAGQFVADMDPASTTDPVKADTDGDGIADGVEDADHDGAIDLGESDPADATSTVGCAAADRSCPAGQRCERNACRGGGGGDGGIMCMKLADRNTECCQGGCTNGTLVTPVCIAAGALEQCPVGASQCSAGTCSGTTPEPKPADEGCGCSATERSNRGGLGCLLVLGLVFAVLRKRRVAHP